jgi:hypothetical protein
VGSSSARAPSGSPSCARKRRRRLPSEPDLGRAGDSRRRGGAHPRRRSAGGAPSHLGAQVVHGALLYLGWQARLDLESR